MSEPRGHRSTAPRRDVSRPPASFYLIGRQRHARSTFTCRSGGVGWGGGNLCLPRQRLAGPSRFRTPSQVPFHLGAFDWSKRRKSQAAPFNGIGSRAWHGSGRALPIGRFPRARPLIGERDRSGTAPFGWGLPASASLFSFGTRRPRGEERSLAGMAAGEGGAESLPPPSPSLPGTLAGPERALEEAVASGSLCLAGRRLRHFPEGAARRWDLSDTTQADLSRNRFAEVPEDACHLMSLEGLSLYHNCLRSLPPAIANLQALTHLNVSRNQISALPACLCRLPLKVLNASNNRLASLPEDIGSLGRLRQLDVSSNELRSLPGNMRALESLRDLNVRRNQITVLPEELAELPLVRLDFSCNLVPRLPVCFRHLRQLQCLLLENNPLQFPPAQVCQKGKMHIFKYLNVQACGKGRPDLAELTHQGRPTGFGTCLPDDFYPARQHGGLDSGFHSVDSGSKRWSGNESTDEFSDLSFRIAELARDPKQLREKRGGAGDAGELEQIDYIDSSVNGEEEEEDPLGEEEATVGPVVGRAGKTWSGFPGTVPHEEPPKPARIASQRTGAAEPGPTVGRGSLARPELSAEERRRPELLQLWQERERQQPHQRWTPGTEKPDSSSSHLAEKGGDLPQAKQQPSQGAEPPPGSPRQSPRVFFAGPLPIQGSTAASLAPSRDASLVQRPCSFLFRSSSQKSSQRSWDSPSAELGSSSTSRAGCQAPDEEEVLGQLRTAVESHLKLSLGEDLGEALADGVILCQLANRLCPRSVPFIHVPSPAVPKLNAAKSRKNLQSFLDACRRLGVPEVSLCGAPEIAALLQGNLRGFLGLLEALPPPPQRPAAGAPLSAPLAGFGVFYACVMLLLYFAYCQLCGFCFCC